MSVIRCDGFDEYTTILDQWGVLGGANTTIQAAAARTGPQGLQIASSHHIREQCDTAAEHATFIVGAAINRTGSNTTIELQFLSDNVSTQHVTVLVNAAGTIEARRGTSGGTLLGSSAGGIVPVGSWKYLEAKVVLHDTTGSVVVRLDGVVVLNLSGQDTRNAGTKSVFDSIGVSGANTAWVDDLYWLNGAGSANNDFLGDVKVVTLFPTGQGTTTQSAGTGQTAAANLWQNVDDAAPNTTDYNSITTSGDKDTYAMGNLPAGVASVKFAQLAIRARKSDAGAKFLKRVVRSGGADYAGPSIALGTGFAYLKEGGQWPILETDPATGLPWTPSAIDALEAGWQASDS